MSIEDDLKQFLKEGYTFHGEVREFMKNNKDHLDAVSKKAGDVRQELEKHKESYTAHGWGMVAMIIAGLGSAVAIFAAGK